MTAFKLLTPPAREPVTLDDAKAQARIDTNVDDALIANLITGARQWAEQYTGRAFITQTWQMWLDIWPPILENRWDGVREGAIGYDECSAIKLPRPPLASVTSVTYYDASDNATIWAAGNYFVDTVSEPGRLALRSGATWPVPGRFTNGICITYTAGYGDDEKDVPEVIRTAIRQLVAHWYEHRGEAAVTSGTRTGILPVPIVIQALLEPYRIKRLI